MIMHFPDVEERPLSNPPLAEVICQIRFQPILTIAYQPPTDFQGKVRRWFPTFTRQDSIQLQPGISPAMTSGAIPTEYQFTSADQLKYIGLGANYIALSTKKYLGWKSFLKDFQLAVDTLFGVYDSISVTRIGLRYINVLKPENAHLNTVAEIAHLLTDEIRAGFMLGAPELPRRAASFVQFEQEDQQNLSLRFAMESDPIGISMDYDCFSEFSEAQDMSATDIVTHIGPYHELVYRAFRWSLKETSIDRFA